MAGLAVLAEGGNALDAAIAAYGGSLDSMEGVVLDDLAPSLIGEDPFHVERLWSRMARRSRRTARSTLSARTRGRPLRRRRPSPHGSAAGPRERTRCTRRRR